MGASLDLDARQRAMLDEMGVKVWWPVNVPAAAAAATAPVADAAAYVDRPPAESPAAAEDNATDVPARFDDEAPAAPAERAPRAAPPAGRSPAQAQAPSPAAAPRAGAGAAVLADEPRLLHGAAHATGGWLLVADMPPEADGRYSEPFSGDAGRLLENMLRALQLHVGPAPVHLVRVHRSMGAGGAPDVRRLDDVVEAQAAALAPRMVLAMGPLAAQSLMRSSEPLGKLRGRVASAAALGGAPVVATYHPAYLLRTPADKARAWADLCLAAEHVERSLGPDTRA